jgi:hypothetical protein
MPHNVDVNKAIDKKIEDFVNTVCKPTAAHAEQYAKDNAPWTDRTGEARKMLLGGVINTDDDIGFFVAHRKDYGEWLETANDGRYAILRPTVEHFRDDFLNLARKTFGGK